MFSLMKLRHKLVTFAGRYPLLFFASIGLRKQLGQSRGVKTVSKETELVIEGFLRSANSFATRAFLCAQSRKVIVANRSHAPATIIRSARWNIPTLVLIRDPKHTVLSYMLKKPYVSARDGFREYIAYYQRIFPHRDHYVVASFDEVITDFGVVTERINHRFNTNFQLFNHTPENVQKVFDLIEHVDRGLVGDDLSKLSIPKAEKEGLKDRYKKMIEMDDLLPLVREADHVYRNFLGEGPILLRLERGLSEE